MIDPVDIGAHNANHRTPFGDYGRSACIEESRAYSAWKAGKISGGNPLKIRNTPLFRPHPNYLAGCHTPSFGYRIDQKTSIRGEPNDPLQIFDRYVATEELAQP
jgi:hypothetical protein